MLVPKKKDEVINVSKYSKDKLGKMLSIGYSHKYNSIVGDVHSLRTVLDYLTIPGYNPEYLLKKKLTKEDIERIPGNKVKPVNYDALLAYLTIERIKAMPELYKLMKSNTKPYTAYHIKKVPIENAEIVTPVLKLKTYIDILTDIDQAIKSNEKLDDASAYAIIHKYKKVKDKSVFEGCVNINVNKV